MYWLRKLPGLLSARVSLLSLPSLPLLLLPRVAPVAARCSCCGALLLLPRVAAVAARCCCCRALLLALLVLHCLWCRRCRCCCCRALLLLPRVAPVAARRCCCRALLLALLVLHCLWCPVSTAYSRRGPKSYDVRIFTPTTTAMPCAERLDSSDVRVSC